MKISFRTVAVAKNSRLRIILKLATVLTILGAAAVYLCKHKTVVMVFLFFRYVTRCQFPLGTCPKLTEYSAFEPVLAKMSSNQASAWNKRLRAAGAKNKVFQQWRQTERRFCADRVKAYANLLAELRDVHVHPMLASSASCGGENWQDTAKRSETAEQVDFRPGFLRMDCDEIATGTGIDYHFKPHVRNVDITSDLDRLMSTVANDNHNFTDFAIEHTPTLVVHRYEFVNLYHTVNDWYGAFLACVFFGIDPSDVQVLLVDTRPRGLLDETWSVVFNRVIRLRQLPESGVRFSRLVFSIWGYTSPIFDAHTPALPLVEHFREYFLARHGLAAARRRLQLGNLSATLVLRRQYPNRRPLSTVTRLFANDDQLREIITGNVSVQVPAGVARVASTRVVYLEEMPMVEQLRLASETDILIGMHGAALTLSLFLPKHAGVVELFPIYAKKDMFDYMRCLCVWRQLHYVSWVNEDSENEVDFTSTRIPPTVFRSLVERIVKEVASNN